MHCLLCSSETQRIISGYSTAKSWTHRMLSFYLRTSSARGSVVSRYAKKPQFNCMPDMNNTMNQLTNPIPDSWNSGCMFGFLLFVGFFSNRKCTQFACVACVDVETAFYVSKLITDIVKMRASAFRLSQTTITLVMVGPNDCWSIWGSEGSLW